MLKQILFLYSCTLLIVFSCRKIDVKLVTPIYPGQTKGLNHIMLNRNADITHIDLDGDGETDINTSFYSWYSPGGGPGSETQIYMPSNVFITQKHFFQATYLHIDTSINITTKDTFISRTWSSDSVKGILIGVDSTAKLIRVEPNEDISKITDWGNETMLISMTFDGGEYYFADSSGYTYLGVKIIKNNQARYGWIRFSGRTFLLDCAMQK